MAQLMHYPDLQVCVLAAGKGKRMRSSKPKVLHPVLGRAMIDYLLHTVEMASSERDCIGNRPRFRNGTGTCWPA